MESANTGKEFISLDIEEVEYDDQGIVDFYWPIDNKKSEELMNALVKDLIPYVTDNEAVYPELVSVRLLFKWFVCEVLRIYEASLVVRALKKDGKIPVIPKHYKKLEALYEGVDLECNFFLGHINGPSYGSKIPRPLKRIAKEVLWNGLKINLIRQYGSNKNDVLAIGPPKLARQHAEGAGKLLRYSGFDEWFVPIARDTLTKVSPNAAGTHKVLAYVEENFRRVGHELSAGSRTYLTTWLNQASNFVNFHLKGNKDSFDQIKTDVWFGCGGASVWHVIMIEKLRCRGVKVVTHDHGSGNSHHDQTPVHWVEFMHTDHFITFNDTNERNRGNQLRADLLFGKPSPKIESLDSALRLSSINPPSETVNVSKQIKKIMYVGTAFHGEGARLRPIFHDMTYFDWQIKLLAHLRSIGKEVIYKPHPEGATKVPKGFAESFGFRSTTRKFETISEDVDAYLIDFIFSSTTPAILKTNKPVFFIDLGFPAILPDALELIKKRCYYLKADYSNHSRLQIDFEEFDRLLNRKEHFYDTTFVDLYFKNVG